MRCDVDSVRVDTWSHTRRSIVQCCVGCPTRFVCVPPLLNTHMHTPLIVKHSAGKGAASLSLYLLCIDPTSLLAHCTEMAANEQPDHSEEPVTASDESESALAVWHDHSTRASTLHELEFGGLETELPWQAHDVALGLLLQDGLEWAEGLCHSHASSTSRTSEQRSPRASYQSNDDDKRSLPGGAVHRQLGRPAAQIDSPTRAGASRLYACFDATCGKVYTSYK